MSEAHNVVPNMRLAPAESPSNPTVDPIIQTFE